MWAGFQPGAVVASSLRLPACPWEMNELDEIPPRPVTGRLARLGGDRDVLAKSWLVRLIERSSLDEIAGLPTDRITVQLPP